MDEKEYNKAIQNIQYDICQDCDWYVHDDYEYYDQCDPDPIVYWCGYCSSQNKGYCGLLIMLKNMMTKDRETRVKEDG